MKAQSFLKFFVLSVVSCSFLLSSCSADRPGSAQANTPKGDTAPDFTLKSLSGENISLHGLLEKNSVLLMFTTTWCPACVKIIPELKAIYSGYKDKNIDIVAVYIKEPGSRVSEFKAAHDVPYKVLLDTDSSIASLYNIRGVPTLILIDKKGKIRYTGHSIAKDIIDKVSRE